MEFDFIWTSFSFFKNKRAGSLTHSAKSVSERENQNRNKRKKKNIFFLEIRRLVLSIWASNFACFDWILVLRSCLFNGMILIIRFIKLIDWDSVLMNYNASTFSDYWLLFLFIWIVLILIWVFFLLSKIESLCFE